MKSRDRSDEALEQVQSLALVNHAWMADRDYIIVVRDRDTEGGLFDLLNVADRFEMDGKIRIVTDFLHDGESRETVHLESVDRVEPSVS